MSFRSRMLTKGHLVPYGQELALLWSVPYSSWILLQCPMAKSRPLRFRRQSHCTRQIALRTVKAKSDPNGSRSTGPWIRKGVFGKHHGGSIWLPSISGGWTINKARALTKDHEHEIDHLNFVVMVLEKGNVPELGSMKTESDFRDFVKMVYQ